MRSPQEERNETVPGLQRLRREVAWGGAGGVGGCKIKLEAFQPWYEKTILTSTTDPTKLYDLKTQLDEYQLIWPSEVDSFARVFFKPQSIGSKRDHGLLNSFIDPAVDRYRGLEDEEKQDDFKNTLAIFVRLYAFLAQIMPFADVELEKFYAYARLLLTKLPKQNQGERLKLEDEVALEYYRLQKIKEGSIVLQKNGDAPLESISEAGTRHEKEERARLSEIIDVLNERFGAEVEEADKYEIRPPLPICWPVSLLLGGRKLIQSGHFKTTGK